MTSPNKVSEYGIVIPDIGAEIECVFSFLFGIVNIGDPVCINLISQSIQNVQDLVCGVVIDVLKVDEHTPDHGVGISKRCREIGVCTDGHLVMSESNLGPDAAGDIPRIGEVD